MDKVKSGITKETVENQVIGAGAVYVNYGETGERKLGATRGGNTFVVEQEVRDVEVDGAKGKVKGMRRIITVIPRLTVNLLEMSADNIVKALPGSEKTDDTDHDEITRDRNIELDDYIDNIAIVATVSGTDEPIIVKIDNALADNNFEMSFNNNDEVVTEIQFTGHFDYDDLDTEPWEIRYPKN